MSNTKTSPKPNGPAITAKATNGNIVKESTTYNGQLMPPGSTQRLWLDEDGNVYSKTELTFWLQDQEVQENSQTKVFEIIGFQPIINYTDNYIIDKYYEVFPSDNSMKKEADKDRARLANLNQMRKLWDHLNKEQVVGRGEFCPSSKGFIASDGYLRAIKVNGTKWGLELGVFKEEKIFQHIQEGRPKEVQQMQTVSAGKTRIKMV